MLFCVGSVVFRIDLDGHCYCFHNDNARCRCVCVILLSWSFVLFVWRCVDCYHAHSLTTPCCFVLVVLFLELIWMGIATVFTTTTLAAGVFVLFCCLGVLFCLYGGVLIVTTHTHSQHHVVLCW